MHKLTKAFNYNIQMCFIPCSGTYDTCTFTFGSNSGLAIILSAYTKNASYDLFFEFLLVYIVISIICE